MAQDRQASTPTCYIEFRIHDPERFTLLERFFKPLKEYSQALIAQINNTDDDTALGRGTLFSSFEETQETLKIGTIEETMARRQFAKPEEWLLAFRPQDLEKLRMPKHAEAIAVMREWQGMTRRERRKAIKAHDNRKQLRGLADFTDMLKYWQDVEFELVSLLQTDPDKGRITYTTFNYPFNGKAALEELLMFFGFLSILKDPC